MTDKNQIYLRVSDEMYSKLMDIAGREFNSVPGVCRRFISEGIALAEMKNKPYSITTARN